MWICLTIALSVVLQSKPEAIPAFKPFAIEVVDRATGRGVPLVELRTVNEIRYITDSNGLAAIDEPGLMGKNVFFHVKSHGYEFPKDGFGYRGKSVELVPGGTVKFEIDRLNIAERLYRVTGEGIYRDSVLVGKKPPIREPLLNGGVLGSDSVVNSIYQGKIYWFWGDTNRSGYPLGNFHVPGAVSKLPTNGGLDPDRGVDLTYFVNPGGFASETAKLPGDGPTWIFGLTTIRDADKTERLFAHYQKIKPPMDVYEHGLAEFKPRTNRFEKEASFEKDAKHRRFYPGGQTLEINYQGSPYIYHAMPFPITRVKATVEDISDLSHYESYTCLKPGSRVDQALIDRDSSGKIVYAWKPNTPPLTMGDEAKLIKEGKLEPKEALLGLRDIDTGKTVLAHTGSVYWNAYRHRYVMITVEQFGSSSLLGEVWYAEADNPLGPWVYAKKIVTHQKYSFYNPKQHPMFDKEGGKTIYFEGTYTQTFSGNQDPTPRYDYNQVMYRLDLTDPRLNLPVGIYGTTIGFSSMLFYMTGGDELFRGTGLLPLFFALEKEAKGSIPVYSQWGTGSLTLSKPLEPAHQIIVFHALPADAADPSKNTALLYEYRPGNTHYFIPDGSPVPEGWERSAKPLCRVWINPVHNPSD